MASRHRLKLVTRRLLPAGAGMALLAGSLFLANESVRAGSATADHYPWVLGAALAALLILMLAIGSRLWRLRRDLRRGSPGARLTRRLLIMLVLLGLPPVVLVYGFALRFIDSSVDTWFDVKVERALDDALEVGRILVDERLRSAETSALDLADGLRLLDSAAMEAYLDEHIDSSGASQLTVFAGDRHVIALAASDPRYLNPPLPDSDILMRVRGDGRHVVAEPLDDELMLRVVLPLDGNAGAPRLLQGMWPLSARLQQLTDNIEQASLDFRQLKFLRGSLKLTFALILTFVLLLSVLFAVLAAFDVTRRLVAPIGRLMAATRAVSAGRYDTALPVASDDELGVLVRAFGQMTQELQLASARASRMSSETEQHRAWLQAVLERLSAGVLGFDHLGHLRMANRAAEGILAVNLGRHDGHSVAQIQTERPDLAPFLGPLGRHLREGLREWREEVVIETATGPQVLLVRGAALPGASGSVAVFDDLTILDRAQRDAAWGEVARRLAHEVKNPLTPIQLSAERLRRRFLGRLPDDDADMLDRATHTIVTQVEALKEMVNAFGDYARPAQLAPRPLALHVLIDEVLDLYRNDQRIVLLRDFADAELMVRGDSVRLRQALHNLLKNALEAIGDSAKPQIRVSTEQVSDADAGDWVLLSVADNGPGLPADFDERWFEPYTTSKARGTGLGLAVVKKIVDEHGGSLQARNLDGGGACITLRLPLVDRGLA